MPVYTYNALNGRGKAAMHVLVCHDAVIKEALPSSRVWLESDQLRRS